MTQREKIIARRVRAMQLMLAKLELGRTAPVVPRISKRAQRTLIKMFGVGS